MELNGLESKQTGERLQIKLDQNRMI